MGFLIIRVAMIVAALFVFASTTTAGAQCVPTDYEKGVWAGVSNSTDPDQIIFYLDEFSDGCFRKVALLKLEQIIPTRPLLAVTGFQQDGPPLVGGNGQWVNVLANGGKNGFQKLGIVFDPHQMPAGSLAFNVQCDAAGVGLTPYLPNGGPCPPQGAPFIQGFAIRLTGLRAKYYSYEFDCYTIEFKGANPTHRGPTNDWCGVRAGAGQIWINRMKVDVTRVIDENGKRLASQKK